MLVSDERGRPDGSGAAVEPLDLRRWGLLAASAARTEGVGGPAELGLVFVDESYMASLAAEWMRSDHPTDVLAFPLEGAGRRSGESAGGGVPPRLVGDVVVCPAVAERQAAAAGHPTPDELALLIVHGVLHLLGHDHAGPLESLRMKQRTRSLLRRHYRPATTGDPARRFDTGG